MNVFALFENQNIEDIKLGIRVVKTLGLEKEFEEKIKTSFIEYEDVFNNFAVPLSKAHDSIVLGCSYVLYCLLFYNLDMGKLGGYEISLLSENHPKICKYLLSKFSIQTQSCNNITYYDLIPN